MRRCLPAPPLSQRAHAARPAPPRGLNTAGGTSALLLGVECFDVTEAAKCKAAKETVGGEEVVKCLWADDYCQDHYNDCHTHQEDKQKCTGVRDKRFKQPKTACSFVEVRACFRAESIASCLSARNDEQRERAAAPTRQPAGPCPRRLVQRRLC